MNNNTSIKRLVSVASAVVFTTFGGFVLLIILLLNWGRGQALPNSKLRELQVGMTCSQAISALGSDDQLCSEVRKHLGRETLVEVASSGLGAYFTPQRQIVLVFDPEGRLTSCIIEHVYMLDEHTEQVL